MPNNKRCNDEIQHVKDLICTKQNMLKLQCENTKALNLAYCIQAKIANIVNPNTGLLVVFLNSLSPIIENLTSGQSTLIPITPSQFCSMFSTLDVLADAIGMTMCDVERERKLIPEMQCHDNKATDCLFAALKAEVSEQQMAAEMTDVNNMIEVVATVGAIAQLLPDAQTQATILFNVLRFARLVLCIIKIYLKQLQCILNKMYISQEDVQNGIAAETQIVTFASYELYLLTQSIVPMISSEQMTVGPLIAPLLTVPGSISDVADKLVAIFISINDAFGIPESGAINVLNTIISNECVQIKLVIW